MTYIEMRIVPSTPMKPNLSRQERDKLRRKNLYIQGTIRKVRHNKNEGRKKARVYRELFIERNENQRQRKQ
jgi:hypothetical protein